MAGLPFVPLRPGVSELVPQVICMLDGAAYLDTWEAGSIGQWGTGPDPLTPEQADAIAALMAAGEDL